MILAPNKYKISPEISPDGNASRKTYSVTSQMSCLLLVSLVAMALLIGGNSARAQQITGAIAGTVTDPAGAVVPKALIQATNTGTGFSRTASSDNAGAYLIQYLPVGLYSVEVTAPGFKKFVGRSHGNGHRHGRSAADQHDD